MRGAVGWHPVCGAAACVPHSAVLPVAHDFMLVGSGDGLSHVCTGQSGRLEALAVARLQPL